MVSVLTFHVGTSGLLFVCLEHVTSWNNSLWLTLCCARVCAGKPVAVAAAIPTCTGKVCIIPRGDISFCNKVIMCANAGGVAAIIYNNAAGAFGGTLTSTCAAVSSTISSLALAQELANSVLTGGLITGAIGSPYPYAYWDG